MRKVLQYAVDPSYDDDSQTYLIAICDDQTSWYKPFYDPKAPWTLVEIPELPPLEPQKPEPKAK